MRQQLAFTKTQNARPSHYANCRQLGSYLRPGQQEPRIRFNLVTKSEQGQHSFLTFKYQYNSCGEVT